MLSRSLLLLASSFAIACGGESPAVTPQLEEPPPENIEDVAVQIGVPAGSDNLGFAALEPNGELRLQTFGQGGTHVLLAIRCIGFGKRAFVGIEIKNLQTGAAVRTEPPVRPQLLYCHDERVCDLVPLLAMTSGLTEVGAERDGLRVQVGAFVRNEAGLSASVEQEAVFSTADL